MIDIRIVCTHDALGFAETLMRLLGAEEHQVRLCVGRHSLNQLEAAKDERDAVMLIWSDNAPSQHYMLEWARGIDPKRLVEIARSQNAPRSDRRTSPVDFTNWRGERGARAWNALNDRLRTVARAMAPPQPAQTRAAIALGVASAAAVVGAVFVRANDVFDPNQAHEESIVAAIPEASTEAMGGPLIAVEPASLEDTMLHVRSIGPAYARLEITQPMTLEPLSSDDIPELRDPTFVEILSELNPLRGRERED